MLDVATVTEVHYPLQRAEHHFLAAVSQRRIERLGLLADIPPSFAGTDDCQVSAIV